MKQGLFLIFITLQLGFAQHDATCSHLKTTRTLIEHAQEPTRNQLDIDVHYYDIDLEIFPNSETISGSVEVYFTAVVPNVQTLDVDLTESLSISSITQNGENLNYFHQNNLLSISLNESLNVGESAQVNISYSGAPPSSGFGAFGFSSAYGEDMIWTLSEPYGARNWWPCKDTPTDKADSVDISITVPEHLIVASNGLLVNVEDNNSHKTYHWEERYPITTYLVSLAIYPYTVFYDWFHYGENDSMRLDYYVYPQNYSNAYPNYMLTKDMLAGFSERFGLYPFIEEKYGHADFVWGGGMEHQTISSMGGTSQYLISHELGHQWWGDMVTCANFHHIWLNEGFATYSQAMWYEIRDNSLTSLHNEMANKVYYGAGSIYVSDTTNVNAIFNSNLSYNKASWVLHMLRHIMGDDAFFSGLREYGDQYRFSSAVTEQFTEVMSSVHGQDLSPFINRWIYGQYYPQYESTPSFNINEDGSYQVEVMITQNQSSEIFPMPVDILLETVDGSITFVADVTENNQTFSFEVNSQPLSASLDPDRWILRTVNNGDFEFVYGCTEPNATNYNPNANVDDGSCVTADYGDVNADGTIDILDIVIVVNIILGLEPTIGNADVNTDGIVNIQDIIIMVNWIIGG
jgi:aminopeptidase N